MKERIICLHFKELLEFWFKWSLTKDAIVLFFQEKQFASRNFYNKNWVTNLKKIIALLITRII